MLKDAEEKIEALDKLHRDRTRWVTATWVFGALFAVALIAIFGLGAYLVKPDVLKGTALDSVEKPEITDANQAAPDQAPQQAVEVAVDDDPGQGEENAPVTVIEFSDFLCPYCAASEGFRPDLAAQMKTRDASWEAAVPKIIETYVKTGKVRFVFRDCPFHGESAIFAAEAAGCAQEQGKYWEMHSLLFQNQDKFPEKSEEQTVFLQGLADQLGLEKELFSQCLASGKYKDEINKDLRDAQSAGVTGTPTYFINGQKAVGAQSFSAFQSIIEAELLKE